LAASRSILPAMQTFASSSAWLPRIWRSPLFRFQPSRTELPRLWRVSCSKAPWPNKAQAVIAAGFSAAMAISGSAWADPLSVDAFGQLALRCGPSVALSTLASIARTESGFQPLTINDNTTRTSGVPATGDIAIQIASKLLEAGHSVDIGIMLPIPVKMGVPTLGGPLTTAGGVAFLTGPAWRGAGVL
jgi:hypothetical protein